MHLKFETRNFCHFKRCYINNPVQCLPTKATKVCAYACAGTASSSLARFPPTSRSCALEITLTVTCSHTQLPLNMDRIIRPVKSNQSLRSHVTGCCGHGDNRSSVPGTAPQESGLEGEVGWASS